MRLNPTVQFDKQRDLFVGSLEGLPGLPVQKVDIPKEMLQALADAFESVQGLPLKDPSGFFRPERFGIRAFENGITFEFVVEGKRATFSYPAPGKNLKATEDAARAIRDALAGISGVN